jgi:multidrug efflux pump subunit AcrA (membrane-fusion protein)
MPILNTHSEELQEIMGRIPSRVIRRGTMVIFAILVVILVLSWVVKYPEMVTAPITITTLNPPADLMAKSTGKIEKLFVGDGQQIEQGEIVSVLFNIADYNDVFSLEHLLDEHEERWPEYTEDGFAAAGLDVGELQASLSQFNSALENYAKYTSLDYIGQTQKNLADQIAIQRSQLASQREQLQNMSLQYELEKANFARDSTLYAGSVISGSEYERSQQATLQTAGSLISQRISISGLESSISSNEGRLIELDLQRAGELNNLEVQLKTTRDNLLAQIASWRNSYTIKAPVAGKITFTSYWNENQNISTGERFATIVPESDAAVDEVIGKVIIPSARLGKVAIGQTVHVKLNGYPYMEFGILKGDLSSISAVPDATAGGYSADVRFPSGLVSTYKKQFELIQQMDGTAEIVTRDMRLIERFFAPIRNVLQNS